MKVIGVWRKKAECHLLTNEMTPEQFTEFSAAWVRGTALTLRIKDRLLSPQDALAQAEEMFANEQAQDFQGINEVRKSNYQRDKKYMTGLIDWA